MKQLILLVITLFMLNSINAQVLKDTILYFGVNGKIVDKSIAKEYLKLSKNSNRSYTVKYFTKNEKLTWDKNDISEIIILENDSIQLVKTYAENEMKSIAKRIYSKYNDTLYYFRAVDNQGKISEEFYSKYKIPIIRDYKSTSYYPDKNQKVMDCIYDNNQLVSCILFNASGDTIAKDLLLSAEVMPKCNRGDFMAFREAVQREMVYPPYAVENGIKGRVTVQFIIYKDGTLGGLNILSGVDKSLDNECIRAIRATKAKWTPGYNNGEPVNVLFTFPLIFQIQ